MAHVCPYWLGYFLLNPFRQLVENSNKLLKPFIDPGMTVADIGCAMGFHSLPMARMVGKDGRVVCVDLQQRMIEKLKKRARKAGLLERIDPRVCGENDLGLSDLESRLDFAAAFHVFHEVPDKQGFMHQVHRALKPGGRLLVVEPKGHSSEREFTTMTEAATRAGFTALSAPSVKRARAILFAKG